MDEALNAAGVVVGKPKTNFTWPHPADLDWRRWRFSTVW